MRDCRIHAIFEGTSGVQALDLVHRRLLRGDSFEAFMTVARAAGSDERLSSCLDLLDGAAVHLRGLPPGSDEVGKVAMDFLQLSILAASGWIAVGLLGKPAQSPAAEVLHAAARYWLSDLADRGRLHHARIVGAAPDLAELATVRRNASLAGA